MAIAYTPTAGAKIGSTSSGGAIPFTPGQAFTPPPASPAPVAPIDPRQAFQPQNVAKLPGQIIGGVKSAFNFLTGSEQAAGQDITAALPGSATGVDALNKTNQQSNQSDVQFIQAMNARKASGQQLTPQQQAIFDNILNHHATTASDLTPALDKSNLQVAGDFAGVAADIAGAGSYSKAGLAGKSFELAKGTPTVITAADSAINKVADVAKGLGTPKPTSLQEAIDITKPVLYKKESIAAMERAGQPGGVTTKGALRTYDIAASPRDQKVAQSVIDVVSPKASPLDNIANINGKIGQVSETQVRPFLQKNPSAFNLKTLNKYILDNTQIPNYIKADPVLQRTYDLTRDSMLEEAANHPKTMEGLWDARISFDSVAERQGIGLTPGDTKLSAVKQAVLDTRRAVNDFIAESTPNGDANFKGLLQQMNQMYEARGNIAEQNYKLLQKNVVERWLKQNPQKAQLLKYGLGAVGLGVAGDFGLHLMAP